MANNTGIEWADLTINPIVGCSKCSPGCDRCYAERWAKRMTVFPATKKAYSQVMESGRWNGQTYFDPTCFGKLPQKPARIFVGSMGDVFHETVSQMQIDALFNMMSKWPQHTFMLLTKRAQRMRDMVMDLWNRTNKSQPWVLPNVWLGITAENQDMLERRWNFLATVRAPVRFISMEPLLSEIDASGCLDLMDIDDSNDETKAVWARRNVGHLFDMPEWIIVGGETGDGHRALNPYWARTIRDQCKAAKVSFFMKQMSGRKPIPNDLMVREVPK